MIMKRRMTTLRNLTSESLELKLHQDRSSPRVFLTIESGQVKQVRSSELKKYSCRSLRGSELLLFGNKVGYRKTLSPFTFIRYSELTFKTECGLLKVLVDPAESTRKDGVILATAKRSCTSAPVQPESTLAEFNHTNACASAPVQPESTLAEFNHTNAYVSAPVQPESTLAEVNHTNVCAPVSHVQSESTLAEYNRSGSLVQIAAAVLMNCLNGLGFRIQNARASLINSSYARLASRRTSCRLPV